MRAKNSSENAQIRLLDLFYHNYRVALGDYLDDCSNLGAYNRLWINITQTLPLAQKIGRRRIAYNSLTRILCSTISSRNAFWQVRGQTNHHNPKKAYENRSNKIIPEQRMILTNGLPYWLEHKTENIRFTPFQALWTLLPFGQGIYNPFYKDMAGRHIMQVRKQKMTIAYNSP